MWFTIGAVVLIVALAKYADRANERERQFRPGFWEDDQVREAVVHAKQDLKLIVFLLGAVIIMLGIVADRIHALAR